MFKSEKQFTYLYISGSYSKIIQVIRTYIINIFL